MQLGGSLNSHFKDEDFKNTMDQIPTAHNTPASEMQMCGFDCVLEMSVSLVFDHSRASPAQAQNG